uniref:Minor capsid protein L2 n=1 Tax=Kappapapillomavirus 2 TaxID=10623 RepID=Q9IER8_9PAPI|nr:L2 [Kappapapillomavirus 2]
MVARSRKRRAAPQDIYPTCKIAGNCPADIQNKFENKTIADKILQYGSLGVFFGGLGISSAGGSGGRLGYTPLSGGGGSVIAAAPVRPPITTESVGPLDIVPEVADPGGPTLVPLHELPAETPYVSSTNVTGDGAAEPLPAGHGGSQISDVTSDTSGTVSRTHINNPAFEAPRSGDQDVSDVHVFAHAESSITINQTENTGGELIEMVPLRHPPRSEGDFRETSFSTSTPNPDRSALRSINLASRRYQQVQVENPAFLNRPRELVQFENTFDNPAFVDDEQLSLLFEQDLDTVVAAPDPAFQDVVRLSRPSFTQSRAGRVRVSRLGRTLTMQTRSAKAFGPAKHFYYELSSIAEGPEPDILIPESEQETSFIDATSKDTQQEAEVYADGSTLETDTSADENLTLVFSDRGRGQGSYVPIPGKSTIGGPINIGDSKYYTLNPRETVSFEADVISPVFIFEGNADGTYYLEEPLRKKRRKSIFLLADGSVAVYAE